MRVSRAIDLIDIPGSHDLVVDATGMRLVGSIENVWRVRPSASDIQQCAHLLYVFGLQGRFLQQEAGQKCLPVWQANAQERSRTGKRKQMSFNSAQTTLRKGITGSGEEARQLELGPSEIDEAVGSEMVEIILEGFARKHVVLCQAERARSHSSVADCMNRDDGIVLLLRAPDEAAALIGNEIHSGLMKEIAPEVIHASGDDVINDRIDLHRGNRGGMFFQSGEHLSAATRADDQNVR